MAPLCLELEAVQKLLESAEYDKSVAETANLVFVSEVYLRLLRLRHLFSCNSVSF